MSAMTLEQVYELAVQRHTAGALAEAESLYRWILSQQPHHAGALHLLGLLAHQVGKHADAVELIRRSIQLNPEVAEAHLNLGTACQALGQFDQAIDTYQQAITLRPEYAEAYTNLGNALRLAGRGHEAIAAHEQAIAINPVLAEAWNNLGNALQDVGEADRAVMAFERAIVLRPHWSSVMYNLANALRAAGRIDEAIAMYRQTLAIDPSRPETHCNLGNALKESGRLKDAIAAYRQALAVDPSFREAHSNLLYAMLFVADCDPETIAAEASLWNARHARCIPCEVHPRLSKLGAVGRRLRIGYVSADFRDHVIGRNLLPLFRHHDRERFEIICYSQVRKPDEMTAQFQRCRDLWREISKLADEQVAQLIRQDQVDILVDLTMHLAGNRLGVFARKPAPVQVSFAAYPGSTGLTRIDCRISDPYLDPLGMDESIYSERTIRLPNSFWCYDPLDCSDLHVNELPALARGFITFGCLNNFCKINEQVLTLWARVMSEVPGSRLLLLAKQGSHRELTRDLMTRRGIAPDRIEFIDPGPRRNYLLQYHQIDVGLDSFPYNGHTTSLDSFWMGVPVVSPRGRTVVGRAGFSQLSNLGLTELSADTPEDFVRIASALSRDVPYLANLRRTLRERMQASPLMDARSYARGIEDAYREMWRNWDKSETSSA